MSSSNRARLSMVLCRRLWRVSRREWWCLGHGLDGRREAHGLHGLLRLLLGHGSPLQVEGAIAGGAIGCLGIVEDVGVVTTGTEGTEGGANRHDLVGTHLRRRRRGVQVLG